MSDFTALETCSLEPGDLVTVGRGRVIWRVVLFWRDTEDGVWVQLQATHNLSVFTSRSPAVCRLLEPRA